VKRQDFLLKKIIKFKGLRGKKWCFSSQFFDAFISTWQYAAVSRDGTARVRNEAIQDKIDGIGSRSKGVPSA
jgi:hypothetical protein